MTRPALALALALTGCNLSLPDTSAPLVIHHDSGGDFAHYVRHYNALAQAGTPVRLEGQIVSAGVIYAGLPNACMAPGSRYGFHATSVAMGLVPAGDWMDRYYASLLPPALRDWYLEHGRRTFVGFTWLSAQEMADMGAGRLCND